MVQIVLWLALIKLPILLTKLEHHDIYLFFYLKMHWPIMKSSDITSRCSQCSLPCGRTSLISQRECPVSNAVIITKTYACCI